MTPLELKPLEKPSAKALRLIGELEDAMSEIEEPAMLKHVLTKLWKTFRSDFKVEATVRVYVPQLERDDGL